MDISVGFWLIGILLFGILIGLPVALSLIVSSMIGIASMRSIEIAERFLAAAANDSINEYLLPSMLYGINACLPLGFSHEGCEHLLLYVHPVQAMLILALVSSPWILRRLLQAKEA